MAEPSLSQLLPEGAIATGVEAPDRRSAVQAAGELLVEAGAATGDYIGEMHTAVERYGPYIVIAPGLALAHSRPSPAVLHTGLSWAGLKDPVEFGHGANDPVRLVVGLAALDHDGHASALSRLARMLSDPGRLARLTEAAGAAEVRRAIGAYES